MGYGIDNKLNEDIRRRRYYDISGYPLTNFTYINQLCSGVTSGVDASLLGNLSGLTVTASQLNYATGFPASCAYAVSAGTAARSTTSDASYSASYAESALHANYGGSGMPVLFTEYGGMCLQFLNYTGATSVKGNLVMLSSSDTSAVTLSTPSAINHIGAMYSSGVVSAATCWVVVLGVAEMLLATGLTATAGDWLGCAGTTGYVSASNSPPNDARHDAEIGHCTLSTGTAGLTRGVLHFR